MNAENKQVSEQQVMQPSTSPVPAQDQPVVNGREPSSSHSKKRKLTILTASILAIAALVGAGAAAYYTVVVANKPEYVLKRALENSLRTPAKGFDAHFTFEGTNRSKFQVSMKGQSDGTSEAARLELLFKMDGASIPLEVRTVGKDTYLKADNLKELLKIKEVKSSEFAESIDKGAKVVNGQWIEVKGSDASDQGTSCYQDLELKLTEEDVNLLFVRYSEVPFSTIKQVSDDTVNGRDATKYELQIDGSQLQEYAKGMEELGFIKKFNECDPTLSKMLDENGSPSSEGLSGSLTVWVDKDNEKIAKLAAHSAEDDKKRNNGKGSIEVVFSDETAAVERPQGAKSFMEILTQLLPQLDGLEGLPAGEDADEI